MTQQYLVGELSLLIAQVQAATGNRACAGEAARLRQEEETLPITALPAVVTRALDLTDASCWDSLSRGDTTAFARQAAIGAQLFEFGVCAGLLATA
jgi:hypothetical protein